MLHQLFFVFFKDCRVLSLRSLGLHSLRGKMYFKPLFVFHFVACFKKSLYYIKVAQIGVEKLRRGG